MTDRKKKAERPASADRGREGFGDDGGSRVGRPDPAKGADRHTGPSSQPVKEGLEGAVFEGEQDAHGRDRVPRSASSTGRGATGAGAEAAEGTHGAQGNRASREESGVDESADSTRGGADRRGSEPLADREDEHVSGYGGAGGQPKHSSDQREGSE